MKKSKLLTITSVLMILVLTLVSCEITKTNTKDTKALTKVRLNEVVRSVFYAPMYAAINQGFFKEEGLEIDLSTGQGADKTAQQVLSKNADIGFCGPEQIIYIHNQQRDDLPVIFAQLTQRDGSFLVSRSKEEDFKWESLKGKTIIGGRPGGVPEMSLEYVLRNHGIQPNKDVKIITNLAFTATAGAFKSGTGDYVALFEPTASMLEKDNAGYIVASVGQSAGVIPYTCFFSTKSYINQNPQIIEKFTRAIYKGQLWVQKSSDEEVAKAIKSFFPGTDEDILVNVIKNYRSINAFAPNPTMQEEAMSKLMDIIQSYDSNLIPARPSFEKLVDNSFSEKVVKELSK
ncbi:ABC transporter substrate-binding protein [Clostridium polyendosporum]|uniref:ABC transporter substrate-binding protein n=1 Tax=Clostridium polyendosporum TaxID=69208 RepID=A0A919RWQ5_9CLOT|nr:ABC transporter substrate-binding protein [Clostridium polyendosporum]GIM27697.1 ABC transporter substrate-binding protein [Clostridium polyendosporum]